VGYNLTGSDGFDAVHECNRRSDGQTRLDIIYRTIQRSVARRKSWLRDGRTRLTTRRCATTKSENGDVPSLAEVKYFLKETERENS